MPEAALVSFLRDRIFFDYFSCISLRILFSYFNLLTSVSNSPFFIPEIPVFSLIMDFIVAFREFIFFPWYCCKELHLATFNHLPRRMRLCEGSILWNSAHLCPLCHMCWKKGTVFIFCEILHFIFGVQQANLEIFKICFFSAASLESAFIWPYSSPFIMIRLTIELWAWFWSLRSDWLFRLFSYRNSSNFLIWSQS